MKKKQYFSDSKACILEWFDRVSNYGFKSGHLRRSHRIQIVSEKNHYSQIWIIFFGKAFSKLKSPICMDIIILLYVWKGRIIKCLAIKTDPGKTLKLAEIESLIWAQTQDSIKLRIPQNREAEVTTLPSTPSR